jgi:16S rRNA (uracil1498-N3)-methyltransferase
MVRLDAAQSRHLRDVLRIRPGEAVELFDGTGRTAPAKVCRVEGAVELEVGAIHEGQAAAIRLAIAAAPPKGSRADWLVEKLSELGVSAYIPLQSARTVVHPEEGKLGRWQRLATESAKQCKRADVMRVLPPTQVKSLGIDPAYAGWVKWCLSTRDALPPALAGLGSLRPGGLLALIGPEGGWTDTEEQFLSDSGFASVHLTSTILRIETAAITVAALVMVAAANVERE